MCGSKGAGINFCDETIKDFSGLDADGDLAKLLHVYFVFPWEDDIAKTQWFSRLFRDRPGDLLRVLSCFRVCKEMGLASGG